MGDLGFTTIAGLIALLLLLLAVFMFQQLRWPLFACMLWAVGLAYGPHVPPEAKHVVLHFTWPLNYFGEHGRLLSGILLLVLVVQGYTTKRGTRRTRVIAAAKFMTVFEFYYAVRLLAIGDVGRGLGALVTYFLMAVLFWSILPNMLQNVADIKKACGAIALGTALFILGSGYQYLSNPADTTYNGRFYGTSTNPNHAAYMMAIVLPPIVWLLLYPRSGKLVRTLLSILMASCLIVLLWTGSRGGTGVALIGCVLTIRHRLGAAVLQGAIVAAALMMIAHFLPSSLLGDGRLLSTVNTRTTVWSIEFQAFLAAPIFGENTGDTLYFGENSYLSAAGHLGIIGIGLLLTVVFKSLRELNWFRKVRRNAGELSYVGDLVTGGVVSILLAGIFEAIFMGIYAPYTVVFFVYLAIMAFLRDKMAADPALASMPSIPVLGYPGHWVLRPESPRG